MCNFRRRLLVSEAFIKMQGACPYLFNLHALLVPLDFVDVTIFFLKECSEMDKEPVNYYNWAEVLQVSLEELK